MDSKDQESLVLQVVGTLIDAAADRDDAVREVVVTSLRQLAGKCPSQVLRRAVEYRRSNPKMSAAHLGALLRTMESVCREHVARVDGDEVLLAVQFALAEMTRSAEYLPSLQMPASGILTALGKAHCNEVMDGLLGHFQPGVLPHYTVLHTMGSLASANVFGIVPFVKATLGTMLPMIASVRTDPMRQVFAYVLGKFSEAVSEYVANIDHAPDPTVKAEAFATELSIAYDVLANTWINSKEPKVVETVLQALGPVVSVLPPGKVSEHVPRLVQTLLAMYRRSVDPHPVTQCLAAVLLVAMAHCKPALEPQLDHLLSVIFDLVCTSPDYAQPLTVKNHYEVLRCFDRIACHFTDRVVDLLVQQLRNNNERERVKALFVVTHLVNSSEGVVRPRAPDVVAGLRAMLAEPSVRVKKVLLKTIVAFAHRGYLESGEGREFVEFIVKHCCPAASANVGGKGGDDAGSLESQEELRVTCGNVLYLLSSTVPQLEATLWGLLLRLLLALRYTPASPVLARCLAHLAARPPHDPPANNNKEEELPNSTVVFARCLALLGAPLESSRGVFVLNFLKNYSTSMNRHLKPLWDQKIPELLLHLEDYKGSWQDQVWDDLVLDFLSATFSEVDEDRWAVSLGLELAGQVAESVGPQLRRERAMLCKCLAVAACHSSDEGFARGQLDTLVACARGEGPADAAARGVGLLSRAHPREAVSRLGRLAREELARRPPRFLNFMKDGKTEAEQERLRRALLLCYAEVAAEAPGTELLPQLEEGPARWILQQLSTTKDPGGKEAALRALASVVEAFHPNRNSLHVPLRGRPEVLAVVLAQLPSGPRVYPAALQVLTALVKLSPPPSAEERVAMLKTCFTHVFAALGPADTRPQGGAGPQWSEEAALMLYSMGTLVQELLLISVTPATLDEVFTLLEPWLGSSGSRERSAATATLCAVLQCYLDNLHFSYEVPSRFSQTGRMLGRLVPRCTDPSLPVRHKGAECVRLVLCLASRYEGLLADHDNDLAGALCSVQARLLTDDPGKLFAATGELAQIVCGKLPQWQVLHFADSLLDSLLDPAASSASGVSVVLNTLFKQKGGELYHHLGHILGSLLGKLEQVQCEQARTGCLRAVLSLATHHPRAVASTLLLQPIPYQPSVVDCWKVLAQDPELSADILEQLLGLVSGSPLHEQPSHKERLRVATLQPLAAVGAMKEMFSVARMEELAVSRFPELFCALYLAVCCYVGASPPVHTPQQGNKDRLAFVPNRNAYKLSPARMAQEAFQSLLLCAGCESVAQALLQCSGIETREDLSSFVDMVPHLVRSVCASVPHVLPKLITQLNQHATSSLDPHRVAVAAFYSELTKVQVNGQVVLLESIISSQLNCLADPSPLVRQLCLTGLASISQLDDELRGRYVGSVLAALTQGLDDQDAGVSLAALRGFSRMLPVAGEDEVASVQGTVAIRIKHLYEREDGGVRAAAVTMFGDLARCGSGAAGAECAFREQARGNLACFLLHLADPDDDVVKACKYALRQVGPLLGAVQTCTMLQDHLVDSASLHLPDFMADFCKLLAEELPDLVPLMIMNALSYLKSSWPAIRGNAGILIGSLHGALPAGEGSGLVEVDAVCFRLSILLRDEDPTVRAKAAKAIGCMFAC